MKPCPKISIEFIPHPLQRYPTVGDWQFNEDKTELRVRVSRMGDWRSEFAVAVHEAFEALACEAQGITDESVTAFDLQFEAERENGLHGGNDEPGDDPRAPYRDPHQRATLIENTITNCAGMPWRQHEKNVQALD
jgi:hypothetical protein